VIPFSRGPDGVSARLTEHERALLADLTRQLIDLLAGRSGDAAGDALYAQLGIGGSSDAPLDPALARLLPDAYRDDPEAASEHRHLTERGLVDRKVANARAVAESLGSGVVRLDAAGVQAWLRTLTDLRLTVAARLQIEEDGDEGIGDELMLEVYDWLGYLQGTLVEVIDPDS
jgi:hypothetical protein